jgi:hypothetical protein
MYSPPNTLLKIATGDSGVAQNKAEVDVFTNPKTKQIVATIFDFAKDYSWLSSELVNPFDSPRADHQFDA